MTLELIITGFAVYFALASLLILSFFISKRNALRRLELKTDVIEALNRRIQQLEKEVHKLPFFNLDMGAKVPLGRVGTHTYLNLDDVDISGQVKAAHEILEDETNLNKYTAYLETTEGIFCRTIEAEAEKDLWRDSNGFVIDITWKPIHVGKSCTVLEGCIVYKNQIMKFLDMKNMTVRDGDTLKLHYRFTS
jgi:hypothetical protein